MVYIFLREDVINIMIKKNEGVLQCRFNFGGKMICIYLKIIGVSFFKVYFIIFLKNFVFKNNNIIIWLLWDLGVFNLCIRKDSKGYKE